MLGPMKGAKDFDDDEPYAIMAPYSPGSYVVPKQTAPPAASPAKRVDEKPSRKTSGWRTVLESKEKLRFLLENILPHTGLMYIGGLSGTGKTILAIQTVVNMIQGKPTMSWRLADDAGKVKALFLSLEMGQHELQMRQIDMGYNKHSDEELDYLEDNLIVYREAEPFRLWEIEDAKDLARLVIESGVNLVLIDSASVSFAESLKDNDAQVNKSLENLRMIRMTLEVAMIVVAHTRKPPNGNTYNPEDVTINDLFGHSGVAQHASSIWILTEDRQQRAKAIKSQTGNTTRKKVHFVNVKNRFGASNAAFTAELTSKAEVEAGDPLMFRRDAIALPPMTEEQRKKFEEAKRKATFANTIGQINFSDLDDKDEK